MGWLSVPAAAERLGIDVSRVRVLARDGDLGAERIGGRWIIDEVDLDRYAAARPHRRPGRPFHAASAWALLALADGRTPNWLAPDRQRRLAAVLEARALIDLVGQLRRRADVERWYIHPSLVDPLLTEHDIVLSGARATRELANDTGPPDIYSAAHHADALRSSYTPGVDTGDHNVVVRIVDDPWPFRPHERIAWPVVAAVDLLDSHPEDPRCRAVARRILDAADA